MSGTDNAREGIAHELALRSDEEARRHVLRLFPNARCEREDGVVYWTDENGPVAFHDASDDGVHLVVVRRCDPATFLQLNAQRAVSVLHGNRVCMAYPAPVVRAAVRDVRARGDRALIPLAIERHYERNSETAILIPCDGDREPIMLDEPELALAVRQYRRRLLRVV